MDKIHLLNVDINLLEKDALISKIIEFSSHKKKKIVGNVNTKAMNIAFEEPQFSRFLKKCDLVFIDGFGPLLAAKVKGYKVKKDHRNGFMDFYDLLLSKLEKQQKKIFFLGGTQHVIDRLHPILKAKHPKLDFQAHHGFFEKSGSQNQHVIQKINAYRPDILHVGFGMPLQEYWIDDYADQIDAGVFLPAGACLDFYTHTLKRAPAILTNNGLEWLTRLVAEPRRLWRRYLIGNPKFFYRLYKHSF